MPEPARVLPDLSRLPPAFGMEPWRLALIIFLVAFFLGSSLPLIMAGGSDLFLGLIGTIAIIAIGIRIDSDLRTWREVRQFRKELDN